MASVLENFIGSIKVSLIFSINVLPLARVYILLKLKAFFSMNFKCSVAVIVPDCILLTPETIEQLAWMPKTCAYRLVYEGKNLPDWHPLISGSADTVMKAGHSVAGQVFPEGSVEDEDMANHIRNWDDSVDH